jgi:tripartite ATP-independent transporter DctM subunit
MTLPELKKRGYPDGIAIGSLAGSGTLGLLIPPSIIMIVYGVSADVSIARLFIAGVIPGIMLALLFGGYVAWWAWRNPSLVPKDDFAGLDFMAKLKQSGGLIPTVLLIVAVLGSIYAGIATATESAAIGVVGALVLSAVQGSLTRENFFAALLGATRTTTMIMLILAGSAFLTIAMGFTGLPRDLALWVKEQNFSPLMLIAALTIFFVILGCFLDGISMVVLTMAVLLPMVQAAGFDLVWFGIFIVLVVEMAQITPPVGFNLFVLQGMTGRNIFWIAKVSLPFFFLMVVAVALIVAFPGLATWLPSQMLGR